jgi:hypothetical protein
VTDRIEELQRLHEAATKGWKPGAYSNTIDCNTDRSIVSEWIGGCGFWDDEDRDVAIAARNALPALLRVARAAKAIRDRNQVSDWVLTSDGELIDHRELFAGLDELEKP